MDTNNKVAIVTGGIGGIGFATVRHLLRNGVAYVAILDLAQSDDVVVVDKLKNLEQEFNKGKFGYYHCDVTNVEQFTAIYKKVVDLKNYVDILVNNAGINKSNYIDLMIAINFNAVVHGTMIAIDHMDKRKGNKGGVVVNIASEAGLKIFPYSPLYSATKHAVVSFVRNLKDHNKTFGVRILCICPGLTETGLVNFELVRERAFEFISDETLKNNYIGYMQKPDNVASAIVEIIHKGDDGDVWFSGNDEPPFAVRGVTKVDELRIPI